MFYTQPANFFETEVVPLQIKLDEASYLCQLKIIDNMLLIVTVTSVEGSRTERDSAEGCTRFVAKGHPVACPRQSPVVRR